LLPTASACSGDRAVFLKPQLTGSLDRSAALNRLLCFGQASRWQGSERACCMRCAAGAEVVVEVQPLLLAYRPSALAALSDFTSGMPRETHGGAVLAVRVGTYLHADHH